MEKISSDGRGGYIVCRPFELRSGVSIEDVDGSVGGEILRHPATLQRDGYIYILSVSALGSETEASVFLDKLSAGLFWTSFERIVGIKLGEELYHQIALGRPMIGISNKLEQYFADISAGAGLPNAELIVRSRPKLKLGAELYSLSHFQTSESARFVTLCSSLEVLAPSPTNDPLLVNKIEEWQAETRALAGKSPRGSENREAFEALTARLDALKTRSHRKRVREYVLGVLTFDGDAEAAAIAKDVVRLYDLRGKVLHDGFLALDGSVTRLDEIMRKTLKAAFRHVGADEQR